MPANTRAIKGRIKSIKNTRKITKAMELVAAAKMRKAVDAALHTRPFAHVSWEVLRRVVGTMDATQPEHSLLAVRPVERLLVVLVTSNRGLVGGLNSNLLREVLGQMKLPRNMSFGYRGDTLVEPMKEHVSIDVATVGKKGERAVTREGFDVIASFGSVSDTPAYDEAGPISRLVRDAFVEGRYDKIVIAYNDFISAVAQKPRIRQLLPVSTRELETMIESIGNRVEDVVSESHDVQGVKGVHTVDYTFEPNRVALLDYILPKVVTTQIFQALLESSASEHSARMVAMKNASDAARDLIDDLQFTFNQLRQAGITAEIAEISAGKAALE